MVFFWGTFADPNSGCKVNELPRHYSCRKIPQDKAFGESSEDRFRYKDGVKDSLLRHGVFFSFRIKIYLFLNKKYSGILGVLMTS